MLANCLPSTGSNTLGLIVLAAGLAAAGYFLIRSSKSRAAMLALAIAAGGLVALQTTTKPAEAACTTPTTVPSSLTIQFIGEANVTLSDLPQNNSFSICEHATQNCVSFDATAASLPIGTTRSLTLGTSPSTLDVTPTQVQCNLQLWSSPQDDATVAAASIGSSPTGPNFLVAPSSGSTTETAATFSNGTTLYVATMNEC